MGLGAVLSNIGISICFLLGCIAVFKSEYTKALVGLSATCQEGESEIKATYGGFFIGISIYAFIVQSPQVFAVIAFGWLAAASIRLATLFLNTYSLKNLGGVIFEATTGLLCLAIILA